MQWQFLHVIIVTCQKTFTGKQYEHKMCQRPDSHQGILRKVYFKINMFFCNFKHKNLVI